MNFNKMVLELYLNENTSQRAFAKKYEISYSHLNRVLNNEVLCRFDFFEKLVTNMGKKIKIELL